MFDSKKLKLKYIQTGRFVIVADGLNVTTHLINKICSFKGKKGRVHGISLRLMHDNAPKVLVEKRFTP